MVKKGFTERVSNLRKEMKKADSPLKTTAGKVVLVVTVILTVISGVMSFSGLEPFFVGYTGMARFILPFLIASAFSGVLFAMSLVLNTYWLEAKDGSALASAGRVIIFFFFVVFVLDAWTNAAGISKDEIIKNMMLDGAKTQTVKMDSDSAQLEQAIAKLVSKAEAAKTLEKQENSSRRRRARRGSSGSVASSDDFYSNVKSLQARLSSVIQRKETFMTGEIAKAVNPATGNLEIRLKLFQKAMLGIKNLRSELVSITSEYAGLRDQLKLSLSVSVGEKMQETLAELPKEISISMIEVPNISAPQVFAGVFKHAGQISLSILIAIFIDLAHLILLAVTRMIVLARGKGSEEGRIMRAADVAISAIEDAMSGLERHVEHANADLRRALKQVEGFADKSLENRNAVQGDLTAVRSSSQRAADAILQAEILLQQIASVSSEFTTNVGQLSEKIGQIDMTDDVKQQIDSKLVEILNGIQQAAEMSAVPVEVATSTESKEGDESEQQIDVVSQKSAEITESISVNQELISDLQTLINQNLMTADEKSGLFDSIENLSGLVSKIQNLQADFSQQVKIFEETSKEVDSFDITKVRVIELPKVDLSALDELMAKSQEAVTGILTSIQERRKKAEDFLRQQERNS